MTGEMSYIDVNGLDSNGETWEDHMEITEKDLTELVCRINEATNNPVAPWDVKRGELVAQVGNYHIDRAYGGFKLVRMVNSNGGYTDVSRGGFVSKRELYNWMTAFLDGVDATKSW